MPMRKRKMTPRMTSGVAKLARAMDRTIKDKRIADEAALAAQIAGTLGTPATLGSWVDARRARRQTMGGMGMYTGHGGFFGDLGHMAFDKIGPTGLGDLGQLGRGLGDAFGKWAGVGAYTGSSNSLVPSGSDIGIPAFASSGGESGSIYITHREYVADIYGNDSGKNFVVQSYQLNPGLAQTFPWLSQLAQNYDEYTFKQLMFSFRSVISDIGSSTTGQVGTVIMATNYNAASPAFTDKQTMMEYEAAMSAKTTEHQLHGVECDPTKKSMGPEGLYVRTNPVLTNQDQKTYDWGKFQLAVSNTPTGANGYSNQIIGELWVSYTVELRKPKYFVNRGLGIARDDFSSSLVPTTSNLFPSLLTGQQNNIGVALSTGGTLGNPSYTLTFPANFVGAVRVTLLIAAVTSLTAAGYASSTTGNVVALSDLITGTSGFTGFAGAYYFDIRDFNVSNASGGVNNTVTGTFNTLALVGGGAHVQLGVVEINPSGLVGNINASGNVTFVDSSGVVTKPI